MSIMNASDVPATSAATPAPAKGKARAKGKTRKPAATGRRYTPEQRTFFAGLLANGASLISIKREHGISRHVLRAIRATVSVATPAAA